MLKIIFTLVLIVEMLIGNTHSNPIVEKNGCKVPENLIEIYAKYYADNFDEINKVELSKSHPEYSQEEKKKIIESDKIVPAIIFNPNEHYQKFCQYEIKLSEERPNRFPKRILEAKLKNKNLPESHKFESYRCIPIEISKFVLIQNGCGEDNYYKYKHVYESVTIGYRLGVFNNLNSKSN